MANEKLRDRFLGAVLGMAIGDALGAPYEGQSSTAMAMAFEGKQLAMTGGGPRRLTAGQWTSGTFQTLTLMESLVRNHEFDGLDVAMTLCEWAGGRPRTAGVTTLEVLNRLNDNVEDWGILSRQYWYESAGVIAGNGALPRAMALTLFYANNLEDLIAYSILLSHITHFDPRSVESGLILNFLLLQLLQGRYSPDLVDQAGTFLAGARKSPSYMDLALDFDLRETNDYTNFSPFNPYARDKDRVEKALAEVESAGIDNLHNTGFAAHTMQQAAWILVNARSFQEGLTMAVMKGGDTSTQGLVAGGLLGARFGLQNIPPDWLRALQDRPRIATAGEWLLDRADEALARDLREGRLKP